MFPHLSENQKANSFEISTPPDVPPPTRCTVSSSASCRQVPTCRDHLHERNRLRALPEWPCDGRLGRRENRVGVVCEHLRASCFESRAHAAEGGSASGNGGNARNQGCLFGPNSFLQAKRLLAGLSDAADSSRALHAACSRSSSSIARYSARLVAVEYREVRSRHMSEYRRGRPGSGCSSASTRPERAVSMRISVVQGFATWNVENVRRPRPLDTRGRSRRCRVQGCQCTPDEGYAHRRSARRTAFDVQEFMSQVAKS